MTGSNSPIAGLDALTRAELGTRFEDLFGRAPPRRMSTPLLRRIIAYRVQEDAVGGPDRALKQRLKRLAEDQQRGRTMTPPVKQIKPGTRLLRNWHGETHSVTVTDLGFEYRGKTHKSLSAIAREITGTRWSGPAFFGLKYRKQPGSMDHAG